MNAAMDNDFTGIKALKSVPVIIMAVPVVPAVGPPVTIGTVTE